MRRTLELLVRTMSALALIGLAGCSRSEQGNASLERSDIHATATTSSVACTLLTRREIGSALGAGVTEGKAWGGGRQGCEWSAGDDKVVQLVVVEDPQYWEDLARSAGGEAMPAIGKQAFVAPWLGSFRAGALTTDGCIYVMTPRREVSVQLLRAAVDHRSVRRVSH